MNNEYLTIPEFVDYKSRSIGKVATYDLLIEKMEGALLEATMSGHISEYELDDGQMKCRTRYRSLTDMNNALNGLIKMRQYYINKHNGRVTVLRGGNL